MSSPPPPINSDDTGAPDITVLTNQASKSIDHPLFVAFTSKLFKGTELDPLFLKEWISKAISNARYKRGEMEGPDIVALLCERVSVNFSHRFAPEDVILRTSNFTPFVVGNDASGGIRWLSSDILAICRRLKIFDMDDNHVLRDVMQTTPYETKDRVFRLAKLVEIDAWEDNDHPILAGMVDISELTALQILRLSVGKDQCAPITASDLREFVLDKVVIVAISHRHNKYEPGHPGFDAKNALGYALDAGLSRCSATALENTAKENTRNGRRTIVWVDNFHTRLRGRRWGPECLLPYLTFDVLELHIEKDDQDTRMWLQLEKRMLTFGKNQFVDLTASWDVHGLTVREGLIRVAIELIQGKYEHLSATYEQDKKDLRRWAEGNLELILVGRFNSNSDIQPLPRSDLNVCGLINFVISSENLSADFCRNEYQPGGDKKDWKWRGIKTILKPDFSRLFDDKYLISIETSRVWKTAWFLNQTSGEALLVDAHESNCSLLLEIEGMKLDGRLTGTLIKSRRFYLKSETNHMLAHIASECYDVQARGCDLKGIVGKRIWSDGRYGIFRELPPAIIDFIFELRDKSPQCDMCFEYEVDV